MFIDKSHEAMKTRLEQKMILAQQKLNDMKKKLEVFQKEKKEILDN